MFNVILVPIDRSPGSEVALAHAVSMAETFDARLVLLHVVDTAGWADLANLVNPLDWQIRKAESEAYLKNRTYQIQQRGLQAEWYMLEGDAAAQTQEFINAHQVDLLILNARGKSADKEWNIGSVAFKLAEHARTSFLLVRSAATSAIHAEPPADVAYQRILLPMDGSQRAECVLPVAAALSRKHSALITLAHVVQRPEMPRRTPLTQEDLSLSDAIVASNRAEAERYLAVLKDRLPGQVEDRVLIGPDALSTLYQLGLQDQIDLIVLSAHGYSNRAAWPYGSLTAGLTLHGVTSVLVVQDMP
ncbi:MAG TPA: universal stress protein [Anaerolineae bacterium]|jgi:nucleotide-binding universal stress UspA family protein